MVRPVLLAIIFVTVACLAAIVAIELLDKDIDGKVKATGQIVMVGGGTLAALYAALRANTAAEQSRENQTEIQKAKVAAVQSVKDTRAGNDKIDALALTVAAQSEVPPVIVVAPDPSKVGPS